MKHREIIYNGKSAIRSTYNSLGTQMDDYTQHGYKQYHSHEDYQLMYLQEGKAEITINDVSHIYSPGNILLLGPNLPHKIEAHEGAPCKGILIQFKHSLFPQNMENIPDYHFISSLLQKSLGGLLFLSDEGKEHTDQSMQADSQLASVFVSIHLAEGIHRLCLLLSLLDRLGRKLQTGTTISHLSKVPESLGAIVEKCKRYIKIHYQSDISLPTLSANLGVNDTALCRKFKEKTGETIFQYLIRLRLEAACRMLRNSRHSISEIAYRCGFNTLPHFNRKFKEMMGVPPKEFRERK